MAATEISVSIGGVQIQGMSDAPRIDDELVDLTAGDGSEDDASRSVQDIYNIMAGQFDFLNPAPVESQDGNAEDPAREVGGASRREGSENAASSSVNPAPGTLSGGAPEACSADQLAGKRNREDDMQCMICLEAWSNSGEHRIVSLACGHVFGSSCITRWLGEKKFCPSCNAPAKRSHIRTIFVTTLVAMDTTEKDRAVKEMVKERENRRRAESQRVRAEQALMQVARTSEGLQSEVKKLKAQVAQLKQQLSAPSRHQAPVIHEAAQRPSLSQDPQPHTSSQGDGRVKSGYKHLKSYTVTAARVFDFSLPTASVLVSSCADGAVHTLCKINFLSGSQELLPPMHSKPIRDCRVEPQDGQLVLTCSLDKSVKVTSIASNNCVQEYKVEKELWSCCWHPSDRNLFFCGGTQNSLFLFDLRDTSGAKLLLPGARPQPTHSLAVRPGAAGAVHVLGGTVGGLCAWTLPCSAPASEEEVACRSLALPGRVCTSVAANADASLFLASFRRGPESEEPRHVLFKFDGAAEGECEVVETLQGHASAKVMARSALLEPVADKDTPGQRTMLVASADEGSQQSWLWSAEAPELLPHRLYPHASPVLDTQARGHLLGSLSHARLYLYEFKPPGAPP